MVPWNGAGEIPGTVSIGLAAVPAPEDPAEPLRRFASPLGYPAAGRPIARAGRRGALMAEIRSMCAIGKRGQLGLNGQLPWEGETGQEYVADVQRFFDLTRGHVLLVGPRTRSSIPAFAYADRTIVEIRSSMAPADVLAGFPDRIVYVGGGPAVWTSYAAFIRIWDITRLPYDGEADRWFDPAWLCGPCPAG